MATYSVDTLPPDLSAALGAAAKATCPAQPDGSTLTVTFSGEVKVKVVRGDAHLKRTTHIDWKAVAMHLAMRLPANQRAALVLQVCEGVANGTLTGFDTDLPAAAQAAVDSANASKPRVMQPGQQRATVVEATVTVS
jgi:hypothetical protein